MILKKADADTLRKRAMRSEYSTAPIPDLALKCSEKPSVKKMDASEFSAIEKDSESLIGVEGAGLRNSWETPEIKSLIENRKEEKTISKFQPEVLKEQQNVLLKNGSVIKGSTYQIGKK